MTLIRPTIQEVGAAIHMQVVRMAYSAFLDGDGLAKETDYTVAGSAATLALTFTAGTAFVDMPGPFSGFEPCISDSTESRTIATAPNSGTRHDLVYIGVEDIEFGSARNFWDIYIETNPTVGAVAQPKPLNTQIKGWYILGTLDVPAKVTKGSQCVFHRMAGTTAPVRDGGFTAGDLTLPQQPTVHFHRSGIGANGYIKAYNSAPFVPRAVTCVGLFPHSGIHRPDTFNPYRYSYDKGYYEGWWYNPAGDPLTVDPSTGFFEWYAIMWPGPTITVPNGVSPYST